MAMFNFLKKKGEEEKKEELNEDTLSPNKPTKTLTELPEFPTMLDEEITPLPKLEPSGELKKSDIDIPLVEETFVGKPTIYPEKNIAPEFSELKKDVEEQEIELPSELTENAEKSIPIPKKVKILERNTFNPKKPVFVNVKKYHEISNEISLITNVIEESEGIINRLNSIRTRENNELKKLHDSLDGLNKKIIGADNILSRG